VEREVRRRIELPHFARTQVNDVQQRAQLRLPVEDYVIRAPGYGRLRAAGFFLFGRRSIDETSSG
jgi:hypothetical protein